MDPTLALLRVLGDLITELGAATGVITGTIPVPIDTYNERLHHD